MAGIVADTQTTKGVSTRAAEGGNVASLPTVKTSNIGGDNPGDDLGNDLPDDNKKPPSESWKPPKMPEKPKTPSGRKNPPGESGGSGPPNPPDSGNSRNGGNRTT